MIECITEIGQMWTVLVVNYLYTLKVIQYDSIRKYFCLRMLKLLSAQLVES